MRAGPERDAEEHKIQVLRNMPENVFAIGDFIRTNKIDGWVKERLTGLNSNVRYVHNKFMLVDSLTDDPIVIAGSANFRRPRWGSPRSHRTSSHKFRSIIESPKISKRNQGLRLLVKSRA
jgi:hypothetical protein